MVEIGQHRVEHVARGPAGLADTRGDVGHRQLHAVDELALEAAVDGAVGRVAMRVRPTPAIAADRIVHRVGPVADVMAEADDVESAVLLGHGGVLAFRVRRADAAHAHDDAVIGLDRGIRQRAGPAHIGARGGFGIAVLDLLVLLVERDHELVARAGDGFEERELLAEPAVVGVFLDLGEVLGVAPPAVGEQRGGADIVLVLAQEHRAVLGDGLDRGAVDDGVGSAAPGQCGSGTEAECGDGGEEDVTHGERLRSGIQRIARVHARRKGGWAKFQIGR
ncbi:hypothetical protein BES08_12965 [Novosphingobium resinovorum]|uniref:Uncharacterized protein n=1 Tax=Novosphingobium resinovorum TaxID=158500 RepID=A0A1D8A628_9SPHN|nr:hypothetical protein BES08_12965 [Novosphingobium resinovorum]